MSEDFDWVSARNACSITQVFKELELGARGDVKERISQRPAIAEEFALVLSQDQNCFCVMRDVGKTRKEGVEFCLAGGKITVKNTRSGGVSFTVSLTLNNDGECRLRVDNEELEQWQVRRKALEALLFAD